MGLGWTGAYGAAGGQQTLDKLLAQRMQQEAIKREIEQQAIANSQRERQIGQGDRGLDLREREMTAPPPPKGPMSLGEGQSLVDPNTGRIITSIPKPDQPQRPVSVAPGGALVDPSTGRIIVQRPHAPTQQPQEPIVQIMGPNGVPIYAPRSQAIGQPAAQAPRAVTGAERQTLAYFQRMLEAERNARAVESDVTGRDTALSGGIPFVPEAAENFFKSDAGQKYTQAQRMFTEARLRKESGAAIPEPEFANDRRMNFKAIGDRPEMLKQKRSSRLQTIRGTGNAAGKALAEYYGEGTTLDDLLNEFADTPSVAPGAGGARPPLTSPEYDWVNGRLVPKGR